MAGEVLRHPLFHVHAVTVRGYKELAAVYDREGNGKEAAACRRLSRQARLKANQLRGGPRYSGGKRRFLGVRS